jgi:hypothetical protein
VVLVLDHGWLAGVPLSESVGSSPCVVPAIFLRFIDVVFLHSIKLIFSVLNIIPQA